MSAWWALVALVRRWQRNALAAITIALGCAAVVMISTLATASANATADGFTDEDSDTLRVILPAEWTTTDGQLAAALPTAGVVAAGTFTELAGPPMELRSASEVGQGKAIVASRQGLAAFGALVASGFGWPEDQVVALDPGRVLLGARLARDLGIRAGDQIIVGGRTCHVDGLVTDTGRRSLVTTSVLIHPLTAQAWGLTDSSRTLFVRVTEGNATAVKQLMQRALLVDGRETAQIVANTGPTQLRDQLLAEARALMLAVTLSVAAVSVLTVFITLFAATRERRVEIGILHALGTTPRSVTVSLAFEAAILGLVSSVAGFCVGTILAAVICAAMGWTPVFGAWLFAVPLGALVASLVGAAVPALLAGKVDPNELIRS